MWEIHDDNLKSKGSKNKDNDIDININISVDKDGDTCFNKIDRVDVWDDIGHGLNLCDVARGIHDVQSRLDDFGDIRRDERDDRYGRHGLDIGARAGAADALNFEPRRHRDAELPFIDCEWGRLLEANKMNMLDRYAKMGAALKGKEG